MFMYLICLLHRQVMTNVDMILNSCISFIQALEMILFLYVTFVFSYAMSNLLVVFGIRLFNLFKYVESMPLISAILQQLRKPIVAMASSSDVIKPEPFNNPCFKRWQIKTRMWLTDLKLFWVVIWVNRGGHHNRLGQKVTVNRSFPRRLKCLSQ